MSNSKLAAIPAEGVYYVVPRKTGGFLVLSQRSDEVDDPMHMFFWEEILNSVAREYGIKPIDMEDLKTNYMAIPRGRVQKEIDKKSLKETGGYIILHGNDVPVSQIRPLVLQDFGLAALTIAKKVKWIEDDH